MTPADAAEVVAIDQLIARHYAAIAADRYTEMSETFTMNGRLVLPWADVQGRAAIAELLRDRRTTVTPGFRELVSNVVVTLRGRREATATHALLVLDGLKPPARLVASAQVRNDLVRCVSGWLIARQQIEPDGSYDPATGTLADIVARLEGRVTALEAALRGHPGR